MFIDKKSAATATVVIGSGQTAEIQLPWGRFSLIFNPSVQPMNVSLTTSPNRIVFDGTDNPLGIGSTLQIPLANGKSIALVFAIYAIGDGTNVTRVVHYTYS